MGIAAEAEPSIDESDGGLGTAAIVATTLSLLLAATLLLLLRSKPASLTLTPILQMYRALLRAKKGGFGSFLAALEGDDTKWSEPTSKSVELSLPIAARWFRSAAGDGDRAATLPLAVILALFDEVSTIGMMQHDKSHRAGVSVLLSTSVDGDQHARYDALAAGERVTVSSRSRRIGRTLGFCDCTLTDRDGVVLVRGEHVKFMPSAGRVWDLLFGTVLYATTVRFVTWWLGRGAPSPHSSSSQDDREEGDNFAAAFPIRDDAKFKVERVHHNVAGVCHGGAVAIAAAEAMQSAQAAEGTVARSLRVVYLSASKGMVDIAVESAGGSEVRAVVRRGKGGTECATVRATFA